MTIFVLYELIYSFICALIFVMIFYIQRVRDPIYYFSFGEIILGIRTSISYKALFLRFIIIFAFGFIISLIFSSIFITCFSAFLGSFLIVWPAILNPASTDFRLRKKRRLVFLAYVLFVFSSTFICYLAFVLLLFIKPSIPIYFSAFHIKNRLILFVGDYFLIAVILVVLKSIARILDREIKLQDKENDELEEIE